MNFSVPVSVPVIAVAGLGGFARAHLSILSSLQATGHCRLAAAADPYATGHQEIVNALQGTGTRVFNDLDELLARVQADAIFLATPIHLHERQTIQALDSGCHVYVEKPPCATLGEWHRMRAAERASGRLCAVGFLQQCAPSMQFLRRHLAGGVIGPVRRVWAGVRWNRGDDYYGRSSWAGRWHVEGSPVFDGPATNALAHAVQASLGLASPASSSVPEVRRARGTLWRARPIESYDTAYLEFETSDEVQVRLAFTHATAFQDEVVLRVTGERGTAAITWGGQVTLQPEGEAERQFSFLQQPLLSSVVGFLRAVTEPGGEPTVPLSHTLPFMHVVCSALQCSALQSSDGAADFSEPLVSYANRHYHVSGLDEEIAAFQTDFEKPPRLLAAPDAPWLEPSQLKMELPVMDAPAPASGHIQPGTKRLEQGAVSGA